MMNNKGGNDTIVLFLILEEMLSVFTTENNVCCGLVKYGLCYVEVCFLYQASLKAQKVKNLPATWETWVQSLG